MKARVADGQAWVLGAALAAVASGCGSRPGFWDAPAQASAYGLAGGVALVDHADHRVIVLTADAQHDLHAKKSFPVAAHVAVTAVSSDGTRFFALSGSDPSASGPAPSGQLTVVTVPVAGGAAAGAPAGDPTSKVYPLDESFTGLALDPLGRWAVAYGPTGLVTNPNEIVLFDLTHDIAPIQRTIQSFGGTPKRFTFTPPLLVNPSLGPQSDPDTPNGDRRLLVIETDQDVSLIDLDHPKRDELTIPLASMASGLTMTPARVAVDGFDPTRAADARLAVRPAQGSVIYTIAFGPPLPGDANDFRPTLNVTDVGGLASDFAFVHADDGALRLAVLVPSLKSAVLVEPDLDLVSNVPLPAGFANLSIVTQAVGATSSTDVALLWNGAGGGSGVALWSLGQAIGQPTFSIDVPGVRVPIASVEDIPGTALKVLEPSDASAFYVLDLASTRVSPLLTQSRVTLSIAPDGRRVWAYVKNGTQLSLVDLSGLNPRPFVTGHPISALYDVAGSDGASRSLIVLDLDGNVGATVYDALASTTAHRFSSLLLEVP